MTRLGYALAFTSAVCLTSVLLHAKEVALEEVTAVGTIEQSAIENCDDVSFTIRYKVVDKKKLERGEEDLKLRKGPWFVESTVKVISIIGTVETFFVIDPTQVNLLHTGNVCRIYGQGGHTMSSDTILRDVEDGTVLDREMVDLVK